MSIRQAISRSPIRFTGIVFVVLWASPAWAVGPEGWTGAFYAFCSATLAFTSIVTLLMRQAVWVLHFVFAALILLLMASLEGTLGEFLNADQYFDMVSPLLIGAATAGFGYAMAAYRIDRDHRLRVCRPWLWGLSALSFSLLVGFFIVEGLYWLYFALNTLMLLMIACQILPPLTWRSLARVQRRWALLMAVVMAVSILGYYGLLFGGSAWANENVLSANRVLYLLFLAFTVVYTGLHVWRIERERVAALQSAVLAAEEQARTSQALLAAEREYATAREVVQQKTAQMSAASHDIRQPLASLRGALAALQEDQGEHQTDEVTDRIRKAVDYVDDLAGDLAAQKVPDALPGGREEVPVEVIFSTLRQMFSGDARQRGITLKLVASSLYVQAQPLALMRVLSNLINNALLHANCGRVLVGCRRREDEVHIFVCDDGDGMGEAELARVLKPGEKGANSSGDGLGLGIVDEICREQGFHLRVESVPGKGTGFCVGVTKVPLA